MLVLVVLFLTAGVIAGIVLVKRIETGTWQMPELGDFERIVHRGARAPSRVIYLARDPVELRPGVDDASRGRSSVLASVRTKAAGAGSATRGAIDERPVKLPGWKGSDKSWKQVVACVRDLFAPFDVEVTDRRPSGDDFVLVAVGGRPTDLGVKDRKVGGLAPFSGDVIPRPVVFAFSAQLGHHVRKVCDTIGMEVAHAYGLDHGYHCGDVMTYLEACGKRAFLDKDIRCGESKPRACEGGAPTQNSYRRLLELLGPRKPAR